jgi:hypothetical protein
MVGRLLALLVDFLDIDRPAYPFSSLKKFFVYKLSPESETTFKEIEDCKSKLTLVVLLKVVCQVVFNG